jgi:hypothetical protein
VPPSSLDLLTALLSDSPDLRILSDSAAWVLVRENAGRHGVAPLVASIARGHVSGSDREWCDRVLTTSWRRHSRSLVELESVLGILYDAGIPCLVLKGPVLALRHYAPPFLRKPSQDIDLAVKNHDLECAIEAFQKAGYAGVWSLEEQRARSHHFEMTQPERPGLELHFRLSHGAYGIPVDSFFDRAGVYTLPGGREVRVLSPADEILHLVLHRAYGRFATLFHFYEIRKLWRAASTAVRDEALQRAREHHFTGTFALTDAGFRARWKEPFLLPGSLLGHTWLHSRIPESLYYSFEQLSDPGRDLPLGARLSRRWIDFQLTDRPADAARFARVMIGVAWYQLWRGGWRTVKVEKEKRQ